MPWVNQTQSKEDRRIKYRTLRDEGVPVAWARAVRDFHWWSFNNYLASFIENKKRQEKLDEG